VLVLIEEVSLSPPSSFFLFLHLFTHPLLFSHTYALTHPSYPHSTHTPLCPLYPPSLCKLLGKRFLPVSPGVRKNTSRPTDIHNREIWSFSNRTKTNSQTANLIQRSTKHACNGSCIIIGHKTHCPCRVLIYSLLVVCCHQPDCEKKKGIDTAPPQQPATQRIRRPGDGEKLCPTRSGQKHKHQLYQHPPEQQHQPL